MTAAIVFTVLSLLAATLAVGVWVAVSLISVGLISLGVFRSMARLGLPPRIRV